MGAIFLTTYFASISQCFPREIRACWMTQRALELAGGAMEAGCAPLASVR